MLHILAPGLAYVARSNHIGLLSNPFLKYWKVSTLIVLVLHLRYRIEEKFLGKIASVIHLASLHHGRTIWSRKTTTDIVWVNVCSEPIEHQ